MPRGNVARTAKLSSQGKLQKEIPACRRRHALLARIHRLGYEIVESEVDLGPLRLPFVHIADPDRVLDRVAEEQDRLEKLRGTRTAGDELHLPYWAELWDSGAGIAQFLIVQRDK